MPKLDHDLSQIVTRDGEVLVTVGSHWPLTGPLTAEQREKMERTGLCMGCHQNMTDDALWGEGRLSRVRRQQAAPGRHGPSGARAC